VGHCSSFPPALWIAYDTLEKPFCGGLMRFPMGAANIRRRTAGTLLTVGTFRSTRSSAFLFHLS